MLYRLYRFIFACTVLLPVIFLTGCIKDNTDDCPVPGLQLIFRYSVPENTPGYIARQVDRLSVFVFDGSDKFVGRYDRAEISVGGYRMELPLDPGTYRCVVWAGADERYDITDMEPVVYSSSDGRLSLRRNGDHSVTKLPGVLYHGQTRYFTVSGTESSRQLVSLFRTTNDIKITVRGLPEQIEHTITIGDDNGTYHFDHSIDPDDHTLNYVPAYGQPANGESLIADFSVMRLMEQRHPMISLTDENDNLCYSADLIKDYLLQLPKIDFIYDHEFDIEIIFGDGYIVTSVIINGWKIIEEEEDI